MRPHSYPSFARQLLRETANPKLLTHEDELTYISLGLAEESGELIKTLSRFLKGKDAINPLDVKSELGDVLSFVSACANVYGWSIKDLIDANIEKMRDRYAIVANLEERLDPRNTGEIVLDKLPHREDVIRGVRGEVAAHGFDPEDEGADLEDRVDDYESRDLDDVFTEWTRCKLFGSVICRYGKGSTVERARITSLFTESCEHTFVAQVINYYTEHRSVNSRHYSTLSEAKQWADDMLRSFGEVFVK